MVRDDSKEWNLDKMDARPIYDKKLKSASLELNGHIWYICFLVIRFNFDFL